MAGYLIARTQDAFKVAVLPIPVNHLGSLSDSGKPFIPETNVSRRDFMRYSSALAAAGLLVPKPQPVAAQTLTSTERELLLLAIDAAMSAGADYADGRVIRSQFEAIGTREQTITRVENSESFGINVRALVGGSWGFSATQIFERGAVSAMAREAVTIARANNEIAPSTAELAPVDVFNDVEWVTHSTSQTWGSQICDSVRRDRRRGAVSCEQHRHVHAFRQKTRPGATFSLRP